MNRDSIFQAIHNSLQADGNLRTAAENTILELYKNDLVSFLTIFLQVSLDQAIPFQYRQLASMVLKKYLHSKTKYIQKYYEKHWLELDPSFRVEFITALHSSLSIPNTNILDNLTKVYGSIIRIELEHRTNIDVFSRMIADVSKPEFACGILDTLAYACDLLYEETLYMFKNDKKIIYEISMFYINLYQNASESIVMSALRCIYSTVEVFDDMMASADIRKNLLFQIFRISNINYEALECTLDIINRIIYTYTDLNELELSSITEFILSIFEKHKNDLPMQFFEYWNTLISTGHAEIIHKYVNLVVPSLFTCLSRDEYDNSTMTIHKAACFVLLEIAHKTEIDCVSNPYFQEFIFKYLASQENAYKSIGATALGCIVKPCINEFVYQCIPYLIEMLNSEETVNEALFAFAKICTYDISILINHFVVLIPKVGLLIELKNYTSILAILVYSSIFNTIGVSQIKELEGVVYHHFPDILSILINRLDSSGTEEYDLRAVLNSTLHDLIKCGKESHSHVINQLETYLFNKIKNTVDFINSTNSENALIYDDVICSYIVLLESCLQFKKTYDTYNIHLLFIECLNLPKMLARGEIYITLSKQLNHFVPVIKKFIPFIVRDFTCDEGFVVKSALNLISEIAVLLESNFLEYSEYVITALTSAIQSEEVEIEYKAHFMTALGDMALVSEARFEPYIPLCVCLLQQICQLEREGQEEYVDVLKRTTIQMFSCILISCSGCLELNKHINATFHGLKELITCDREGNYIKTSLDMIKDIQRIFGTCMINQSWVVSYLKDVINNTQPPNSEEAKIILQSIINK